MLRALWAYRGFIYGSVKREFQLKYRNSLLGAVWTVLNPLAMIVVYTVIFAEVMHAKLPGVDSSIAFSIYLCAGLLTWGLFSEIAGRGLNIFIDNANMLKKISFPRISLPLINMLNSLVNFAIVFGIFLVFLLMTGLWPGVASIAFLPVLFTQLVLSIGLAVIIGVLNVFFRDVGHFFGIFIQFWFWLTPIVYPASILPEGIKPLLVFNPMYPLAYAYQGIFVNGQWPQWSTLIYPLILGLVLCLGGLHLFRRYAGEMVDEL